MSEPRAATCWPFGATRNLFSLQCLKKTKREKSADKLVQSKVFVFTSRLGNKSNAVITKCPEHTLMKKQKGQNNLL